MSTNPAALSEEQLARLRQAAEQVATRSYAPYSNFHVGAALLLAEPEAGAIVGGCNVENASFRLTTCAEQTAVASAVAQFGPRLRIRAVAIANLNNSACQPCGACRQTLLEFSLPETLVLYPGSNRTMEQALLSDLLPAGFALKTA